MIFSVKYPSLLYLYNSDFFSCGAVCSAAQVGTAAHRLKPFCSHCRLFSLLVVGPTSSERSSFFFLPDHFYVEVVDLIFCLVEYFLPPTLFNRSIRCYPVPRCICQTPMHMPRSDIRSSVRIFFMNGMMLHGSDGL